LRGKADPDWSVDVYDPNLVWSGTTLFADNHNLAAPRIVEVNLLGEIVWEYRLPENLRQFTNPGFDIEPLPNGNVLFVLPRKGTFEIDRKGNVVWSYLTEQISHDADRLSNGNTLVVFGAMDRMNDAQVKEISPKGDLVWAWYARDHFNRSPYIGISDEGWTHTNAASRLANGNTLISLRNFHVVIEIDPKGAVVKTYGEGLFQYPHDPQVLANGNILLANHVEPQRAIEIDPQTGQVVWQYVLPRQLVRDANRLPNGNTLITGSTALVEVTRQGKVVWQLNLRTSLERQEGPARGFYKAERIH
jgi:outer membrane protein assembly factor BamB